MEFGIYESGTDFWLLALRIYKNNKILSNNKGSSEESRKMVVEFAAHEQIVGAKVEICDKDQ